MGLWRVQYVVVVTALVLANVRQLAFLGEGAIGRSTLVEWCATLRATQFYVQSFISNLAPNLLIRYLPQRFKCMSRMTG